MHRVHGAPPKPRLAGPSDTAARANTPESCWREQLDTIADGWRRAENHWPEKVDQLTHELDERPTKPEPPLQRAHDPLAGLDPTPDTDQARAPARDVGLDVDHEADHLARELDRSQEHLAEIDTRLQALDEERAETRWYQRGRRQEIDVIKEGWQRGKDHWQTKVDDLTKEIEERPPRAEAHLERARDFPSAYSSTLRMTRAPNFEPAPPPAAPDIDIGLDL